MRLKPFLKGQNCTVFALTLVGPRGTEECPTIAFLTELEQHDAASYKALIGRIERHANHGPILDERKSRRLKGRYSEGLYEYKTMRGARLLWFYGERRSVVLVDGFQKGAQLDQVMKAVAQLRQQWLEAQGQR